METQQSNFFVESMLGKYFYLVLFAAHANAAGGGQFLAKAAILPLWGAGAVSGDLLHRRIVLVSQPSFLQAHKNNAAVPPLVQQVAERLAERPVGRPVQQEVGSTSTTKEAGVESVSFLAAAAAEASSTADHSEEDDKKSDNVSTDFDAGGKSADVVGLSASVEIGASSGLGFLQRSAKATPKAHVEETVRQGHDAQGETVPKAPGQFVGVGGKTVNSKVKFDPSKATDLVPFDPKVNRVLYFTDADKKAVYLLPCPF